MNMILMLLFQSAMMSLAFKEGVKIPPPALNEVILAANQDIRQVSWSLLFRSQNSGNFAYIDMKGCILILYLVISINLLI